jgi:hypothetical protein
MGVKILDEDGTLIHEFGEGLGKPILYKLFGIAKFAGDNDEIVVLNKHVSDFGASLLNASPAASPRPSLIDEFGHDVCWRLHQALRASILSGRTRWQSLDVVGKRALLREVLFAPHPASEQFLDDFIEETDLYVKGVHRALSGQ